MATKEWFRLQPYQCVNNNNKKKKIKKRHRHTSQTQKNDKVSLGCARTILVLASNDHIELAHQQGGGRRKKLPSLASRRAQQAPSLASNLPNQACIQQLKSVLNMKGKKKTRNTMSTLWMEEKFGPACLQFQRNIKNSYGEVLQKTKPPTNAHLGFLQPLGENALLRPAHALKQ